MGQFSNLGVFRAAASYMLAGITDIVTRLVDGQVQLFTSTRAGGGVLALELTQSGLTLIDVQAVAASSTLSAPSALMVTAVGGEEQLIWTGGWGSRMGGWRLEDSGVISADFTFVQGPVGVVTAQTYAARGNISYAVVASQTSGALEVWRINPNGRLVAADQVPLAAPGAQTVEVRALATLERGGESFVLSLSTSQEALRLWRLGDDGALAAQASLGAAAGLGIATPAALELVQGYGRHWALVAGSGSSSLSVVEVTASGDLRLADHILDTLDTRFQSVQALASVQMGDRVFVFAGGADAGISAFMMLPDGRLIAAGQMLAGADMALDDITALEAVVVEGQVELVVAAEGPGLIRLRFDPGTLAGTQRGGTGNDTLTGGAQDDLLWGSSGNDRLAGGAGADVLVDGAGSDDLRGGAGADVFVLTRDGTADIIRDFDPSEDRLDLSAWGRIYSVEVLPMAERRGAVVIRWGQEALTVYSEDGRDFSADVFTSSQLFGLWHVVEPAVVAGRSLRGTGAQETLTGGMGDDTLVAVGGGDHFIGGGGRDLVDFGEAVAGVGVNLSEVGNHPLGSSAGDRLEGIENLIGSRFADSLIGSTQDNWLQGGAGADRLDGGAGQDRLDGGADHDTLSGGTGADRLEGGAGFDWAVWTESASAVDVDLARATQAGGDAAGDQLTGIEALYGSRFHDRLAGDGAANHLRGAAGDDLLSGANGHDRLEGEEGNDTLIGGSHDDTLIGGAGSDWVVYEGRPAVRVDLSLRVAQNTQGRGVDLLMDIENLQAGWGADTLIGNALANHLRGDTGNDQLLGGDGNDLLDGGAGDDRLEGGLASDRLMGGAGKDQLFGGDGADLLEGSTGDDRLEGGLASDQLEGGEGQDQLFGGDGADLLEGSTGDDRLEGGLASDQLEGGEGQDQLFGGDGADLLQGGSGDDRLDGGLASDQLEGGEGQDQLFGGDGDDLLQGGSGDDRLEGGGGKDRLIGGAGNDQLFGGEGDDTLLSEAGNDRFEGGAGVDLLLVQGSTALRLTLASTAPQNTGHGLDSFVSVENVMATMASDDLQGNSADNRFWGLQGHDRMRGGAGQDMLDGSVGDDWLWGEAGHDLLYGSDGADRLSGGSENDRLEGGAGADWLQGGLGMDVLIGGTGLDIASFAGGPAVRVTLGLRGAQDTGQGRDVLQDIEGLEGSGRGDRLTGHAGDNGLAGLAGNDRLIGLGGRDSLLGGAGADTLSGGNGADRLVGARGNDLLLGGLGADDFVYSTGRDRILDFRAGQGDDLLLDSAALRLIRGLSAREIVAKWGELGRDEARLDFGGGRVVILEGVDQLADLRAAIEVI